MECEMKLHRRGKLRTNVPLDLGSVVLSQGYSLLRKYMWEKLSVTSNGMDLLGLDIFP
jgi:hypothetical protein